MQDNVIEVNNLSLPFAFQNFNISFERNKITAITGANNCGKTTLIRSIIGQIFTDNTIYIFSQELEYYRITELNIIMKSIIPGEFIFQKETAYEELLSSLDYLEITGETKNKKVKTIIKDLELTKIEKQSPLKLSLSDQIKLQLAKCLISQPKILLLDDIFIYMSKNDTKQIIETLKKYQEEMDLTIVLTTSNLNDCLSCDYVYVIDNNTVALEGTPESVLTKDNVLNRIGLELPFMVDLSVKLCDYDLINDINLNIDVDGMVDILWK